MRTLIQIICGLVGAYLLVVIIGNIWTQFKLRTGKVVGVPGDDLGLHGELAINDRIWLSGGYDDAKWLDGSEGYFGTVISFIPGQNSEPAAHIKLDRKITFDNVTGDILVLELRWVGAKWGDQGGVHVELCDFTPEHKMWKDRKQGKWVESHASYKKVTRAMGSCLQNCEGYGVMPAKLRGLWGHACEGYGVMPAKLQKGDTSD